MTEEDRKFLTEELGECWHEWEIWTFRGSYGYTCKKCSVRRVSVFQYRTFDTPDDFFHVWNHMKERDDWPGFYLYCVEQMQYSSSREPFIHWVVDPIRFPELAVGWLRKEKK